MLAFRGRSIAWSACCWLAFLSPAAAQDPKPITVGPATVSGSFRTRVESWDWFGRAPEGDYVFSGNIARLAVSRTSKRYAWHFEVAAPFLLGLPDDASRPGAVGALGAGANYYAANENQRHAAGLFIKQATLALNAIGGVAGQSLRIGRMELADGAEVTPAAPTLAALKRDRIAHRLVGGFTFTHAGRSFDGVRYALTRDRWNVTGFAVRPTRGVFDVDGWEELKINVFYGALTRQLGDRERAGEWRAFVVGYQDYRQASSIDIATAGGHYLRVVPTGRGPVDLLLWGAAQTGSWRDLSHRAAALAIEAGWQPKIARLSPWFRGGCNVGTGDRNPTDDRHGTFFQLLPTPRIYARFPFSNMMNTTDVFATAILRPSRRVTARIDGHRLRLTESADFWYLGGGAFQNATFGYQSRPSNGRHGLASLVDASVDVTITPHLSLTAYGAYAAPGAVPKAIYQSGAARYSYVEALIRF